MAEEKLEGDELEKVPVSGGTDAAGNNARMHDSLGMIEAEMKQATGGLREILDTADQVVRSRRSAYQAQ